MDREGSRTRNDLALTIIGPASTPALEELHVILVELGCNVESLRTLSHSSIRCVLLMLSGSWDAIAKLEDQLPRISERMDFTMQTRRVDTSKQTEKGLPYTIEVIAADRPGIVREVLGFVRANRIHIRELHSNTPESVGGTRVFTLHADVNVPEDTSITTLRGEFMEFCERLNLDAFMEPLKHA